VSGRNSIRFDDSKSLLGAYPDYQATGAAFGTPFVDIDEWRDAPGDAIGTYVHGGFEGTHTLFSLYLPPSESFDGRLLKHLAGGSGKHSAWRDGCGKTGLPIQNMARARVIVR